MALLALANICPGRTLWKKAASGKVVRVGRLRQEKIMEFWKIYYGENVSSGSYDDVRRKELSILAARGPWSAQCGDPNASPNDPTRRYAVRNEARDVLRTFNTPCGAKLLSLPRRWASCRRRSNGCGLAMIPVTLPQGRTLACRPVPTMNWRRPLSRSSCLLWPGSEVLYVGDAHKKSLLLDERKLVELGFCYLEHGILPDVIAHYAKKSWLLLIEAVHSSIPYLNCVTSSWTG